MILLIDVFVNINFLILFYTVFTSLKMKNIPVAESRRWRWTVEKNGH